MKNNKRKISKESLFTLIIAGFLVLAHIAIVLAIILSFRYYAIYPALFGSIVAIVICILIICDIIFFVGFNHRDLALKIITIVLAVFLFAGGTVGTYYIAKANGIVSSVLDSNASKYETFSGKFVCNSEANQFSSLSDLGGKKIGFVAESSNGIQYIAKQELKDAKVTDYTAIEYNTNAELIQGLLDGNIEAMVITSAYREIYSLERDENSPFAKYLDRFIDFYSFEKELKVETNKKAKDISKEPFNVLLIGYSRTDIGSTVGLADSIILASVNPQTYTVSMMSIARDSFVPISCYGGQYDKINSGRSTSRACFIETVENFIGQDIDYYMELDYLGLVAIVDAIGGINVNNPVDFELDGVFVPAGENVFCDGIMALQFCRERHHMPNGDFDRQQHQKEVIIKIAEKFIQSKDINLALRAMDDASEWMSTDMSLEDLTKMFNLLLNTKNYTSLNTFDLVDFQTLRMTGEGGIKYYSYSMQLPLWVYLIYKGSYDESIGHMNEVLGNYSTINQEKNFEFSTVNTYDRPLFYSLDYDDVFMYTPDPMPAYWIDLEGKTLEEAMAWASANGAKINNISYITAGSPEYNAELEGLICSQTARYGSLISEIPSSDIVIMGSGQIDESKVVPNFEGHNYSKAVNWANKYGIPYSIDFDTTVSGNAGDVVKQTPTAYTSIENCDVLKIVVKAGTYTISFDKNGHGGSDVPENIVVTTGDSATTFKSMDDVSLDADGNEYTFLGWFTSKEGGTQVYNSLEVSGNTTVYAHWKKVCVHEWDTTVQGADADGWVIKTAATCSTEGEKERTCKKCGEKETKTIDKLDHTKEVTTAAKNATCTEAGWTEGSKCSVCGSTISESTPIPALGHSYEVSEYDTSDPPNPTKWRCSVCGDEVSTNPF